MNNTFHYISYGAWQITAYNGFILLHNQLDYEYYHDVSLETIGM